MRATSGRLRLAIATTAVVASLLSPAQLEALDTSAIPSGAESPSKSHDSVSDSLEQRINELSVQRAADGNVAVKVRSEMTPGEAETLALTVGGVHRLSAGGYHWLEVPTSAIGLLGRRADVTYVAADDTPIPLGDISQGVSTMDVDTWRDTGLEGNGVDIAVIDVGFLGRATAVSGGDLPSGMPFVDYCSDSDATPHGTGVAEIVHDVAPSANLHLICVDDTVDLANAVSYAVSEGVDVINHSAGWFNTSRGDGTGGPGTPEAIAGSAVDDGIVWINAAGNHAQRHWSGRFTDTLGDDFHEFLAGVDATNALSVGPFQSVSLFLKWDSWPTTNIDYDLLLYDHAADTFVASSTDVQDGGQPPVEQIYYQNPTGSTQVLGAVIEKWGGSGNPRIDLYVSTGQLQYQVADSSIVEPSGHPDLITVGATCWSDDSLAAYSSRGPNIAGLVKPDVSGPTGVSTFAYGNGSAGCTTGFTGTSSSAPHIAGIAALILQSEPDLNPSQVATRLLGNVIDLGPNGKDNAFGAGRFLARGLCQGRIPTIAGTDGSDTVKGTSGPDLIATYGGADVIDAKGGADLVCAGQGNDSIAGGSGRDELYGQSGDDELSGGRGDDTMYGGSGVDTASYEDSDTGVTVDLTTGTASGWGQDTLSSIENIVGSALDDHLTGDDGPNIINGRSGKDVIYGLAGKDILKGGKKADLIFGGKGSDVIDAGRGSDDLRGGRGYDILIGGRADDDIRGGDGEDTVSYEDAEGPVHVDLGQGTASGFGDDFVEAVERILGSAFDDRLDGDSRANIIKGSAGNDVIRGRGGDDKLFGQSGTDTVDGGSGVDSCYKAEVTVGCE